MRRGAVTLSNCFVEVRLEPVHSRCSCWLACRYCALRIERRDGFGALVLSAHAS